MTFEDSAERQETRPIDPKFKRSIFQGRAYTDHAEGLAIATQLTLKSEQIDPAQVVHDVCEQPDGTFIAADPLCELPIDCRDCALTEACPPERKQSKRVFN